MADEWQAKLDTYLDGELPAEQMRSLDAHLRTCASCAAVVANRVQLKRAVQAAGLRYAPSAEFRQKMMKTVARKSGTGYAWLGFSWRWAMAGVAAVIVVAGMFFVSSEQRQLARESVYSELADLHVSTLASPTRVDVVSSDRHTVKPWFQGKIPFTFNLPELQGTEFVLVGGRVAYLGQAPGAQLIYQIRKHEISVFIFQERAARELEENVPVAQKLSFNMESWTGNGQRYFVVSDVAPEDVQKLSQMMKAANGA